MYIYFFNVLTKIKLKTQKGEAENVLPPSLQGGVCVCEGSLKLYFSGEDTPAFGVEVGCVGGSF